MKILIDIQGMQNLSANRGIGRYVEALVKGIIKNKKNHDIYLLVNSLFENKEKIKEKFKNLLPSHHIIVFESIGPADTLSKNNKMNKDISELIKEKLIYDIMPDFFLITSLFDGTRDDTITSVGKFTKDISTATILYDLIPLMSPEKYLGDKTTSDLYYDKIESLKRSDILLSISMSAKNEAFEHLEYNQDKIINISSAVDKNTFVKQELNQEIKDKFNITKPFLMHTSAYEERKNFEGLIRAFGLIDENLRQKYQLVLVCKLSNEQNESLQSLAASCGLKHGELVLTGYISDNELVQFYSSCYLFVFPSKHEGFGLPILEAMNCKAAVIGSNNSSIPEVLMEKEALFNPNDIEDISKKLTEVLSDQELYLKLKENALVQSKRFSWDHSAQEAIMAMENHISGVEPVLKMSIKESTSKLIKQIVNITNETHLDDEYLIRLSNCIDINEKTVKKLQTYSDIGDAIKIRVEGPFDSSYSLALLNRETARAFDKMGHFVVLHSTEGPGDFEPNQNFLNKNLDLKEMNRRVKEFSHNEVDVVSRNLYPPRVDDMTGDINILHHYAWEESGFPQEWIGSFNNHLTGLTCLSTHIEKIMIDNGINIPVMTSSCGVDHWERVLPSKDSKLNIKEFKFLHVSSCFPRKGADIMLEAYGEAFTSADNVILIIKTFKNPHNQISKWIKDAKNSFPNYPKVKLIEEDISEEKLKALYEQCDVLVAPSLAEGFGLPMAEAMLSGLPVITTNWGGQLDFCNDDNSWLVDFTFHRANTHFNLFNSVWAKPKVEELSKALRESFQTDKSVLKEKAAVGRIELLDNFKWTDATSRVIEFTNNLKNNLHYTKKPKIAWISSWNTKCGIATYSELLLRGMMGSFEKLTILANNTTEVIDNDKEKDVIRCWSDRNDIENIELHKTIDNLDVDCVFIQFNFGFFDIYSFEKIIQKLLNNNIKVYITFHSVADVNKVGLNISLGWIGNTLNNVTNIFVHNVDDLNILKDFGLVRNVTLFPHGVINRETINSNSELKKSLNISNKRVIASYGFMLPHKGIKELIEAFYLVKDKFEDTHLLLMNAIYPNPISDEYANECKESIEKLDLGEKVTLINDFLSDAESFSYLDCADLLVMPYKQTQESSSAAVRYAVSTKKPIICTPISIFNDVEDIVHFSDNISVNAISDKIIELLDNEKSLYSKNEIQQKWIEEHDWNKLSKRVVSIILQRN